METRVINISELMIWEANTALHCNKCLQNYHINHLNLTMNYTVCAENCCKH